MDDIRSMLKALIRQTNQPQPEGHLSYRLQQMDAFGERLQVVLANDRHQEISIERAGDYYVLSSTVIGEARTRNLGVDVFYPWLWNRNLETDVVAFTFDKQGRLIGRIEQLAETLDQEELKLYIEMLASECDQMEYLLSGVDVQ